MPFNIEDDEQKHSFDESLRMNNDSAMLLRGTAPQKKEDGMYNSHNEPRDEATASTLAQTAASGETGGTTLHNVMRQALEPSDHAGSGQPLLAYKDGMGEGITELTEDVSYMNQESAMLQSKNEESSSSQLRVPSNQLQDPKKSKVSAFADQVKVAALSEESAKD